MNKLQRSVMPKVIGDGCLHIMAEILYFIKCADRKILIDFHLTNEITATGLGMLCCLSDYARMLNVEIDPVSFAHLEQWKGFLVNTLTCYSNAKPIDASRLRFETDDLILMTLENEETNDFFSRVDEIFEGNVGKKELSCARMVVEEFYENAIDHCGRDRFFIFVGKSKKSLHFGVCDLGISIPGRLDKKYICEDAKQFLEKAFEIGISSRKGEGKGVGLAHLLDIIKAHKGKLTIASGNAVARFERRLKVHEIGYGIEGCWCFVRLPC